jgi:hypothetical protein
MYPPMKCVLSFEALDLNIALLKVEKEAGETILHQNF